MPIGCPPVSITLCLFFVFLCFPSQTCLNAEKCTRLSALISWALAHDFVRYWCKKIFGYELTVHKASSRQQCTIHFDLFKWMIRKQCSTDARSAQKTNFRILMQGLRRHKRLARRPVVSAAEEFIPMSAAYWTHNFFFWPCWTGW